MSDRAADSDLVRAALAGERRAFALLVERHRGRSTTVARRMLRDAGEAEDVAQEAILQAYLHLGRLERADRFGAWLCGIAVNLAKMRLRRRRAHVSLDDLSGGRPVPAPNLPTEPSPEERVEAAELLSCVQEAIALLTPGQRELVLLAYLDGLTPQETAALLGRSPGSVRVGLHRARQHLREHLSPLAARPTRKEPEMIEMTLEDVIVRVVDDEEPRLAAEHRIVLLHERDGDRLLPIWVGPPEGDSLAFGLANESTPRPLTADLTARLLQAAGARVERVLVSKLVEQTFYAVVTLVNGDGSHEVDARPSDALNLAARTGAPIFVDGAVLEESALTADDVHRGLDRHLEQQGRPAREGEWRSLSPELVRAVGSYCTP